jgi:hypothetical protein
VVTVPVRTFRVSFDPAGTPPVYLATDGSLPDDELELCLAEDILRYIRQTWHLGRGLAVSIHLDIASGEITANHGDTVLARLTLKEVPADVPGQAR